MHASVYKWITSWLLGFKQMSQMKETVFATRMGGGFLRLLVVLLAFSQLLSLNAVPVTRTRSLMHDLGHVVSEDNQVHKGEKRGVIGRMNIELNDYPGSGANNRHTPRRGGCIEC